MKKKIHVIHLVISSLLFLMFTDSNAQLASQQPLGSFSKFQNKRTVMLQKANQLKPLNQQFAIAFANGNPNNSFPVQSAPVKNQNQKQLPSEKSIPVYTAPKRK